MTEFNDKLSQQLEVLLWSWHRLDKYQESGSRGND